MRIKNLLSKIKEYFYRLFHPIIFDLSEEYSDVLNHREEFTKRNVLVGTIRRREQLSVNLTHKFYHIPMSELISGSGLEYVAIYQSKNLFRENTDVNGITYYGRITNSAIVKRRDIQEIPSSSNEEYMRFDVDRWQKIEPHIQIREISPQVSLKTSYYQFANARFINELFFKTIDEYVFFLGILDIINDTYDGFVLDNFKVVRKGKKISVSKGKSSRTININKFHTKPYSKIIEIYENI